MKDEDVLKSWEKPNAFIVNGPRNVPVIVAFDDEGKVSERGMEMSSCDDLFPDGVPLDALLLVHVVEGEGTMLVKKLEMNRLRRDDEPLTVRELARTDVLKKMAETLREKYVKKERERRCASTAGGTGGCGSPATRPETGASSSSG